MTFTLLIYYFSWPWWYKISWRICSADSGSAPAWLGIETLDLRSEPTSYKIRNNPNCNISKIGAIKSSSGNRELKIRIPSGLLKIRWFPIRVLLQLPMHISNPAAYVRQNIPVRSLASTDQRAAQISCMLILQRELNSSSDSERYTAIQVIEFLHLVFLPPCRESIHAGRNKIANIVVTTSNISEQLW